MILINQNVTVNNKTGNTVSSYSLSSLTRSATDVMCQCCNKSKYYDSRLFCKERMGILFSVLNKKDPTTSLLVKGTQDIFDELFRLQVKFELGRLSMCEQEIAITSMTSEVKHLTTLFNKVIDSACHEVKELESMYSHESLTSAPSSTYYDPLLLTHSSEKLYPFTSIHDNEKATQLLVKGTQRIFVKLSKLYYGMRHHVMHVSQQTTEIEIKTIKREVQYLAQLWKEVIVRAHCRLDMLENSWLYVNRETSDESNTSIYYDQEIFNKRYCDIYFHAMDLNWPTKTWLVEGTQAIFDQLLHLQNQVHLNLLSVSEQKTAIDTMTREVSHLTKFCNKVITNAFGLFNEVQEIV